MRPRALLVGYLVLGLADTVFAAIDLTEPRWVTKTLLMPVLVAFLVATARPGTRSGLPIAALAGGFVGDVGLLVDHDATFMIGMGGFAVGHVCYIVAFRRAGISMPRGLPAVYLLVWAAMMALVWRGLDDLLVPVLGYSLLLTAMAVCAAGVSWRAGLGGALFLFSDAVIALGIAEVDLVPGQDAVVMPAYVAAQLLLALTWARWPFGPANAEAAADPRSTAATN
ncbi:lysoplasmalogenase [Embleya sp. NBC_00896]|uniref:lysoplasmalogenase n=1 Tax=Embleya sp. NBC_00896 TaxID=2975961 RepID=UPI00386ADD31|nr:lysoplasmalogenase [Embleya sp. NBC_00896]